MKKRVKSRKRSRMKRKGGNSRNSKTSRRNPKGLKTAYSLLTFATFIVIVSSLLLLLDYSDEFLGVTGNVVYASNGFTFSIDDVKNAVKVDLNAMDGGVSFYLFYANSSGDIIGLGSSATHRLVTSNTERLVYSTNNDEWFAVSLNNNTGSKSFVMQVSDITPENYTQLNSIALGTGIFFEARAGEVKYIHEIHIKAENASYSLRNVTLRLDGADSGTPSFSRLYSASGSYMELPLKSQLPTREFNITIYGNAGTPSEKYRVARSETTGKLAITAVCNDADGINYTLRSLSSGGGSSLSDSCLDNNILKEVVCTVDGAPAYLEHDCSLDGLVCREGACLNVTTPVGCTPNWTAVNTTFGERKMTDYADSNNCNNFSGRPQNITSYYDNDSNGIIGTFDDIEKRHISLYINISGDEMDISENYSGQRRPVEFFDDEERVVQFDWNFTQPLNFMNIEIEKEGSSDDKGYLIVNGVDAIKRVYLTKKRNETSQVCIKDSNIASLSEISNGCNESDETLLDCPGSNSDYACDISDGRFMVTGLMHSAVVEYTEGEAAVDENATAACAPSWECTDFGECINEVHQRSCVDTNLCNNETGRPEESEACVATPFEPELPVCTPNWRCTEWPETCPDDGILVRTCTDLNGCGMAADEPVESMECEAPKSSTAFYLLIAILAAALIAIAAAVIYILSKGKSKLDEGKPGVIIQRPPNPQQPRMPVPMGMPSPPRAPPFAPPR